MCPTDEGANERREMQRETKTERLKCTQVKDTYSCQLYRILPIKNGHGTPKTRKHNQFNLLTLYLDTHGLRLFCGY